MTVKERITALRARMKETGIEDVYKRQAYGCNFEKALEWTKNFDPDRITQYESARYLSLIHI